MMKFEAKTYLQLIKGYWYLWRNNLPRTQFHSHLNSVTSCQL